MLGSKAEAERATQERAAPTHPPDVEPAPEPEITDQDIPF
jgi:hypothetical protein